MSSKLRAFVAISLRDATRESLRTIQKDLEESGLNVRWTRPEQFHVTLKFLGEIDRSAADLVVASIQSVVSGWAPFSLTFQGVGAFPGWQRPRVLWSGVAHGRSALVRLAQDVEAALTGAGFAPWERPFRPHLTLGRVQRVEPGGGLKERAQLVAARRAGPERVDRVGVYRSRLTPHGPIYSEIASLPFANDREDERS